MPLPSLENLSGPFGFEATNIKPPKIIKVNTMKVRVKVE
jgi:hypothetical protein